MCPHLCGSLALSAWPQEETFCLLRKNWEIFFFPLATDSYHVGNGRSPSPLFSSSEDRTLSPACAGQGFYCRAAYTFYFLRQSLAKVPRLDLNLWSCCFSSQVAGVQVCTTLTGRYSSMCIYPLHFLVPFLFAKIYLPVFLFLVPGMEHDLTLTRKALNHWAISLALPPCVLSSIF